MSKTIAIVTNAKAGSGVGNRAYEIMSHMPEQNDFSFKKIIIDGSQNTLSMDDTAVTTIPHWPNVLGSKSISWVRLLQKMPHFDGYDLSNQTLSFIAETRHPCIVTVHDIIELTNPQHKVAAMFNKFLLRGIPKATHIIAISEYVKKEIIRYYSIPEERITVIYNGVGGAFRPIQQDSTAKKQHKEFSTKLRLPHNAPVVVSVGSDHPRKNLSTTLQVIAMLKKTYPDIVLIKIGDPGLMSGRKETLRMIDELGLQQNVRILNKVSGEDLLQAYHVSDALLMPSYQEGFGLPVLEAMASGCPVVCSNATSLPEVVGDAGIMHAPDDTAAFAKSIEELFESDGIKESFSAKGIMQAKKFSWSTAAEKTLEVYKKYL